MISKQVNDWINGLIKDDAMKPMVAGPIIMFEVSIPIWNDTLDYIKVKTFNSDYKELVCKKVDEIVETLEFINDSRDAIIKALERDSDLNISEFKPSKVSSVLFDYTQSVFEVSFYVESNEEYHYHIYIKEDKSFDAGYIS